MHKLLLMFLAFERNSKILMILSVVWLNFSYPKGVSAHISAQTIITGLIPDATKHCCIPFAGYAQAHVESIQPNDVVVFKTVGAISIGPTINIQGRYKFLSLLIRQMIQVRSSTPFPTPSNAILLVSKMLPEGRGVCHLSDENHDDVDEEDGD
jgi:hypothetical protein